MVNPIATPAPNAWIPWAQWLAVITMTLEHVARFLLPDAWGLTPWAILLGRTAFPLFAAMVAWHAVHNSRDPLGYVFRMLVLAIVAQIPYGLVVEHDQLNVIFTLALGLLLGINVPRLPVVSALLLGSYVLLAPSVAYTHLGLLLVPAFMLAFQPWSPTLRPFMAVPVLVIGFYLNQGLFFSLVTVSTVAGLSWFLLHHAARLNSSLTSMPRALWLTWYPLHFVVIALLQVLLISPG